MGGLLILVLVVLASGCGDDEEAPTTATSDTTAASGAPSATPVANQGLPVRTITVTGNGVTRHLTVEIAATPEQRQTGLMHRGRMGDDDGMLFVFPGDSAGGFWMKNTLIPLTIAYLGADGRVLETRNGKPQDETILTPSRPYRYVLEVNQGWFERNGIGTTAVVTLPPDLPRGE